MPKLVWVCYGCHTLKRVWRVPPVVDKSNPCQTRLPWWRQELPPDAIDRISCQVVTPDSTVEDS